MSRSGYSDDCEHVGLWRAAVARALRGARGQHFLRKIRSALDAMPVKRLITDEIANNDGEVCTLGAVDSQVHIDQNDPRAVAQHFGIARAMAAEIVYMNDEGTYDMNDEGIYGGNETPEQRWMRMRQWVEKQIGSDDEREM